MSPSTIITTKMKYVPTQQKNKAFPVHKAWSCATHKSWRRRSKEDLSSYLKLSRKDIFNRLEPMV